MYKWQKSLPVLGLIQLSLAQAGCTPNKLTLQVMCRTYKRVFCSANFGLDIAYAVCFVRMENRGESEKHNFTVISSEDFEYFGQSFH